LSYTLVTWLPVLSHERADDGVVLLFHIRLSFLWYGRERVKVMSRASQKRVRCPFMNSLPFIRMQGEGAPRGTCGDRTPMQRPQPPLCSCVRPLPVIGQEHSGRPRTHLQEKPRLVIYMEMPMCREVLHEERHACCSIPPPHRNRPTPPTSLPSLPSDMPVP
jgi:hypothetical protein